MELIVGIFFGFFFGLCVGLLYENQRKKRVSELSQKQELYLYMKELELQKMLYDMEHEQVTQEPIKDNVLPFKNVSDTDKKRK